MDDYKLIQQIGEGSFGCVFKARRKYTGRMVAIKMISKSDLKSEDLISFRREVDILRKVDHPNIMRLLDVFETNTDFCIVSELGRGDLFQIIDDDQKLPESVLRTIAAQLVSALSHLHSKKIIHRDMKPQNILVTANGSLKLCDFGFARALSRTTLVLNSIKGTPLYMAPELVQEHPYTEKIDIWSLGIIIYELYYGVPPYFTDSIYKLIKMIINEPVTWPGPISDEFKDFLLMALQKDPENRASCEELAKHPWIASVDLSYYDDSEYRFKSQQFDEALNSSDFRPPTARVDDMQTVFMNPADCSPDDLLKALTEFEETENNEESPLANSFATQAAVFVKTPETAQKAASLAQKFMEADTVKFAPLFYRSASQLLAEKKFESYFYPFLVNVLVQPYARGRIDELELPDVSLTEEQCKDVKDKFCGSLFTASISELESIYAILVFLVQTNPLFASTFCSAAPQVLPILAATVIRAPSNVISTAAITLIAIIIARDESTFQSLVPFDDFMNAIFKILNDCKPNIESFCLYSSALGFIQSSLHLIANVPSFQKRVTNVSARKDFGLLITFLAQDKYESIIKSLLGTGSISPRTLNEVLCYATTYGSPFAAFPVDETLLPYCIEKLPRLLPIHQLPLLSVMLALPAESVIPHLPEMIDVFSIPGCTPDLCVFVLNAFENYRSAVEEVREKVCSNGLVAVLARCISEGGQSAPPAAVLLFIECILSYTQPCTLLRTCCPDIMNALFAADWTRESAYIVAAHFARLSSEFVSILEQNGVIDFAASDLTSQSPYVRMRAAAFLGNLYHHGGRSSEFSAKVIPLLVKQLKDENESAAAAAAYAVGNAVYHTTEVCNYLTKNFGSIADLLASRVPRASECASLLLANILRRGDMYLPDVLKNGCVERLTEAAATEEGVMIMLPAISSLAQYEDGKKALKSAGAVKLLQKIAKNGSESTKNSLSPILHNLEL